MDVTKATAQLKDTLVFRREQDVPNMRAEMFPSFLERGDLYVGGFAPGGEPVLVRLKLWAFRRPFSAIAKYAPAEIARARLLLPYAQQVLSFVSGCIRARCGAEALCKCEAVSARAGASLVHVHTPAAADARRVLQRHAGPAAPDVVMLACDPCAHRGLAYA